MNCFGYPASLTPVFCFWPNSRHSRKSARRPAPPRPAPGARAMNCTAMNCSQVQAGVEFIDTADTYGRYSQPNEQKPGARAIDKLGVGVGGVERQVWRERIPGGARQTDGLEAGTMGGLRPRHFKTWGSRLAQDGAPGGARTGGMRCAILYPPGLSFRSAHWNHVPIFVRKLSPHTY